MNPEEVRIYPYHLESALPWNARQSAGRVAGVLLAAQGGYACLQPWEALGDAPLARQIDQLRGGVPSALGRRALEACALDGEARAHRASLFDGLSIPPSHATLQQAPDSDTLEHLHELGFRAVKVKLGPDWKTAMERCAQAAAAGPAMRWRFDFNGTLDPDGFRLWARALPETIRGQIDFVEDPCAFEPELWLALRGETGVPLAADAACSDPRAMSFPGICKPSRDDAAALLVSAREHNRPMVVTSNMDHPVGIAWAAFWAARFQQYGVLAGPCGLATHRLHAPCRFSERFGPDGPNLLAPVGTGIGFDDLLSALPWVPLDQSAAADPTRPEE